jgi:hypothetical protein
MRKRWTVREERVNVGREVHVMSMYARRDSSGSFCSERVRGQRDPVIGDGMDDSELNIPRGWCTLLSSSGNQSPRSEAELWNGTVSMWTE